MPKETMEQKVTKLMALVVSQGEQIKSLTNDLVCVRDTIDVDAKVLSYKARLATIAELKETRDIAQAAVVRLDKAILNEERIESLESAVLHQKCANPNYSYRTLKCPEKSVAHTTQPPAGKGWLLNKYKDDQGSVTINDEFFVHWMRVKN